MFRIVTYVPDSHLDIVKEALFDAGAGTQGDYDSCCWQVRGLGQFRPVEGAQPHVGQLDNLHQEPEWKIEMICTDLHIRQAVAALKLAHPYEEPAYQVMKVEDF